ncbi:chorismate mutase [Lapidilactobacillus wuchangensis]|uniref:chorismate mutase n=1 Tax=Lapidilactobacillus wuchangensis TaxID=2486001 RepID=UPI000F773994|nr:chorismate mutase [Lapidilactobacillus wuchangensis]
MLEPERQEIDEIDQQLVDLLVRRLAVSEKIATTKLAHNLPLLDQQREKLVYQRVADQTPVDKRPYLKTLFTDIMLVSKQYQAKLMKAWQDDHATTDK